jgi:hypothetical protein
MDQLNINKQSIQYFIQTLPKEVGNHIFWYMYSIDELCDFEEMYLIIKKNINKITNNGWINLCKYEWALPLLKHKKLSYEHITELCNYEWSLPLLYKNIGILYTNIQCHACYESLTFGHLLHNIHNHPIQHTCYNLSNNTWLLPLLLDNRDRLREIHYVQLCKYSWALPLLRISICNLSEFYIVELCNYSWALPLLTENMHRLTTLAISKLCQYEWALPLLIHNRNKLTYLQLETLCQYEWALPLITLSIDNLTEMHISKLCKHVWALPLLSNSVCNRPRPGFLTSP